MTLRFRYRGTLVEKVDDQPFKSEDSELAEFLDMHLDLSQQIEGFLHPSFMKDWVQGLVDEGNATDVAWDGYEDEFVPGRVY